MPYEKVGKNEPVCIADEVPFDIPESWEWVRLEAICTKLVDGDHNPPKGCSYETAYVMVSSTNINDDCIVELEKVRYLEKNIFDKENERTNAATGDIFFTSVGSLGRSCVYEGGLNICFQRSVSVIHTLIFNYYLKYCLDSAYIQQKIVREATGTAQKGFYLNQLALLLIPIPPIKEQHRIVSKYLETVQMQKEYYKTNETLDVLNSRFPATLKKSILQYAVQGKLVPQNPADEPASVLLERIRTEKEQLVKEGKIKRDKHESVIFRRDNSYYEISGKNEVCIDDQIPFDVPESWEWTRTGSLFQVNPRNRLPDDLDAGFMPMPLLSDGFGNRHDFQIRKWKEIKTGFTHFADGDIVVAKITPCFQNRKSAVISGLPNGVGAGTTELHVLRDHTKKLFMPYCLLIYKTHAFIEKGMKNFSGTAGQQRIGKELISDYLIPIPPLEEQKRIVSAVESIFKKLDDLLD